MITEVKAPNSYSFSNVFLAGSIENGKAEKWQDRFINDLEELEKFSSKDVVVLNPRRDDWDESDLERQIVWELDGLASSKVIAMYIDPNTVSPISLLELGLFATEDIYVCCNENYFRYTNIRVLCEKAKIPLFNNYTDWFNCIAERLYEDWK